MTGPNGAQLAAPGGLVLRLWTAGDVPALQEAFTGPGMASQTRTPIESPADAQSWITTAGEDWATGRAHQWAVTDAAGALLGAVALTDVDHHHATAWVSYGTRHGARGRGVASTALSAAAAWAFSGHGPALHRLELGHRVDNPASCHVARTAGFTVEGVQRAKLRHGQQRVDVELHARLATDPPPAQRALRTMA